MTTRVCLMKNKQGRRARLAARAELDHAPRAKHSAHVDVKQRRKFLKHCPISDAMFCDDMSYVPFRYIRGTLHLPGANPGKGYVAQ